MAKQSSRLWVGLGMAVLGGAAYLFTYHSEWAVDVSRLYRLPFWLLLTVLGLAILGGARRASHVMPQSDRSMDGASLERKLKLSSAALYLERVWPRIWLLVGLAVIFVLVSLMGLWPEMHQHFHMGLLSAFGLGAAASLITVLRVRWPSREEALRRLESRSGVRHRPASSYEDKLTINNNDPATRQIWEAHKLRLSQQIAKLHVEAPEPRTDRYDPFALRAALLLGTIVALVIVGDGARDRLASAFQFGPTSLPAAVRLDAWLTPPPYTRKPPVLLADGGRGGVNPVYADGKPITIPAGSVLIARSSGTSAKKLSVETRTTGGTSDRVEGKTISSDGQVSEVRATITQSGTVAIFEGHNVITRWTFSVTPDHAPSIALAKDPEVTLRGGLKLTYKVEDDYGLASAEAKFEPLAEDPGDPKTEWARIGKLQGPRPPIDRPPVLALRLPATKAKTPDVSTYNDLTSHAWGGRRVRMTLVARDHAGNIGKSIPVEMLFPERRFSNQLARSITELRRNLAMDARVSENVRRALDALTFEPEGFIDDTSVFLGLRSVYHTLGRDRTRATISGAVDHLWHIAVRIEDGRNLSDSARRLRDIQRELAKALRDGASDQEIERLMKELRQALNQYLEQLQRQARDQPMQFPPDLMPGQSLSQRDLDRMLRDLENMARNGSREMAQQMLDQLQTLLDQLQAGRMGQGRQGQGRGNQQMMQMLDQFGNIIGQQQRLMDDTFETRRREGSEGQQEQPGQQGQQGQQAPGNSPGELGNRQRTLRDQLDQLRRGLQQFGQQEPGQLKEAGDAMNNAERALRDGDLETATREQGRALDQLRQGAQQMARNMLRRMQPQLGQGPGRSMDTPRDPLGRPQSTEGPDLGSSVRIPEEIDMQRAREILEELRRRAGEQNRPLIELDYIERLLERF